MPTTSPNNNPPKKRASGKQATRFFLNDQQLVYADSFIPDFELQVLKFDPHHEGRSKAVGDWSETTAKAIMNSALFVSLPSTTGETLPAWIKTIKRRFSNHFVNNMAPKFFKNFYLKHKNCTSSTGSSVPPPQSPEVHRSALAIFKGDIVSPRDLFLESPENKTLLEDKMKEISTEFPNLVGGGLRNKALALLWDSLPDSDRKVWEDAAKSVLHDIKLNRTQFPFLMANHLQRLCERGCLGSVYMSFSFAVRDDSDRVLGHTLYAGYDSEKQKVLSLAPVGYQARQTGWLEAANTVLPRQTSSKTFSSNEDGIPIFPGVDLTKSTPEQLAIALSDYLTAVWNASQNNSGVVPWEDLASKPDNFYDTKLFSPPVKLQNPTFYLNNPINMYKLIEFFRESTPPFKFCLAQSQSPALPPPADTPVESPNTSLLPLSKIAGHSLPAPMTAPPSAPSASGLLPTTTTTPANPPSLDTVQPSSNVPTSQSPTSSPKTDKIDSPTLSQSGDVTSSSNSTPPVPSNSTAPEGTLPGAMSKDTLGLGSASGVEARKKRGRTKSIKRTEPNAEVVPTRASTRKRKASITNSTPNPSGPVNKKKRPGYFYVDADGNPI